MEAELDEFIEYMKYWSIKERILKEKRKRFKNVGQDEKQISSCENSLRYA